MNISTDKLRKQVERVLLEKAQCAEQINRSTGKKYELLREKYKVLNEKYWLLQEKLDYYECETVASDDEIELKRISPNIDSIYPIYLKSEAKKIGHIDYSGYHSSVIVGDVGYIIDADYRGNNYAYKALILLSDYLYRNNIPDFYISVFFDNIPSLKIILKTVLNYDGDIVSVNGDMVTFKCKTKEIKKKTMKSFLLFIVKSDIIYHQQGWIMEKEIIVNNNIIKFENDGIHPNRIYIHEYITNSDCGLEFVLVMSNVFHICAYIKNYDIKKIRFEFDESHPLYQPLLTLLHDKDEIIIDDDNTIYENAKFVKFYKTDKIVMEFVNRLIDEDNKYDFDNFSIYLKNIYPDMHSIVDNKDKKIKYYLAKFFDEAYDALDKYHNKQLIKK